jgi:hypothetical protein
MAIRKKRKTRPKIKIGKKSRPKKKKSALKKIAKWHLLLTIAFLGLYLALGFWLGPGALKQDIKGKVAGASTVLSLHIAGPPGKPDVKTTPGCQGSDQYIHLHWDATNDTDNYDIYRDGALLVSGVTNTHYRDESVTLGKNYGYYIIANGSLGNTQSDTVTETAPNECYVPPPTPPTPPSPPPPPPPEDLVCRIMTLNNIDLTNFRCLPKAKKKMPVFSGTTNASNAKMLAEISSRTGKKKILSSFTANENGYWSWAVRGKLKKTTYIISVRSTDPNDANRYGTCALRFKVSKNYSKKQMKKCTVAAAYHTLSVPPSYKFSSQPNLEVKNKEKYVFSGDNIEFETDFKDAFPIGALEQKVNFQLVDSKNNTIYQVEKNILSDKYGKITESVKVPLYASSGRYKVIAQIMKGDEVVTAEKDFAVKERPVIELSSNLSLTHAQLLSSLGWIAMALATVLLIFFGLLVFEYHLSKYAVLQVTEGELKKDDYID